MFMGVALLALAVLWQRGILPWPARRAAARVVLASVEVHRAVASGQMFPIVYPIVVYERGHHRDAILSGDDVAEARALIGRSVLNDPLQHAKFVQVFAGRVGRC